MKYEIEDIEICKKSAVEAPGILEAMLDYLPWPSLDLVLTIHYSPSNGYAEVTDKSTEFMYKVRW